MTEANNTTNDDNDKLREEGSTPPEQREKPKRQRLSHVCQFCKKRKIKCDRIKPECSNCKKFGIECQYNHIQWVNSCVKNNGNVESPIDAYSGLVQKSREELYAEIIRLKDELHDIHNNNYNNSLNHTKSNHSGSLPSMVLPPFHSITESVKYTNDILVDFYEPYNSLALKGSSHEDHKPLCAISLSKKDQYSSFFICYLMLTLKLSNEFIAEVFKDDWKSKHPNGFSKWMVLLDTKNEDKDLRESIKRITVDRSQLARDSIFPFVTLSDANNKDIGHLTKRIIDIIPTKSLLDGYLTYFFQYIWPVRPFIDEESFRTDLNRIIKYDISTLKPSINLTQRSDFAVLATLLIILRYTNISVHLIDDAGNSQLITTLSKHTISVKAIPTAQLCLSIYKISKKTTIFILQALLYLRCYFRDCPEEGDGISLTQSQNLFGFITQAALSMGLNRDPKFYPQLANDLVEANLRRRIWHSIVDIDSRTAVLSGTLSTLPLEFHINVLTPIVVTNDPLEIAQRDDFNKQIQIREIYSRITKSVNDINRKTSLKNLMDSLDQSRDLIESLYNTKGLIPTTYLGVGSREYLAIIFKNSRIISNNLIQLILEIQIHSSLSSYFEMNSHSNLELHKRHFIHQLTATRKIFDLGCGFLLKRFQDYVNPVYNFELLPLISTAMFRACLMAMATLLRFFHAQDLLTAGTHSSTKVKPESFEKLISLIKRQIRYFLVIYKDAIAQHYYTGLKILASCKYGYIALDTYKFKTMTKIIKFVEGDDKMQIDDKIRLSSEKREKIKKKLRFDKSIINIYSQWMQIHNNKSDDDDDFTLININSSNLFVEFSQGFLDDAFSILNGPYIFFPDFNPTSGNLSHDSIPHKNNNNRVPEAGFTASTFDELSATFENTLKSIDLTFLENFIVDEEFFNELFGNSLISPFEVV